MSIQKNCLLDRPEGAIEAIRKIHGLDQPGRLEEAINILEEWIQKQDHILQKDFSKAYLEATLITCKGSVEKAKRRIDCICTMKTLLPKFFTKTNIKLELQPVMENVFLLPLPKLTNDYYRVILFKLNKMSITSDIFMQIYQTSVIFYEYSQTKGVANGLIIVLDLSQVNLFDVVMKHNSMELHQYTNIVSYGYGARVKNFHLVSDSKAVEMLLKIGKQVLGEKVFKRICLHSTIEELQNVIAKEILPVEYGGTEISIDKLRADWIEELSTEEHVQYMKMMNKSCTDESRRSSDKFNVEYLGMPGSFRNLSVD